MDGSRGEGGGQILRTSLAASLITGAPLKLERIRAKRSKPGLQRQHLTAVKAAAEIGRADVRGAEIGSTEITFRPGPVRGGSYHFAIGTAGSATLVLQTVLPPLLLASEPSRLILEGGTHNSHAPPFDFLVRAFLPLLARIGANVEAKLVRPGYYPVGGGRAEVTITPIGAGAKRLDLMERGEIQAKRGVARVSKLVKTIAEREVAVLVKELGWPSSAFDCEVETLPRGPGNVAVVDVASEHVAEVFTGFGERGVRAETVAEGLAREVRAYLEAGVPVGEHLADQLILPLAIAAGGAYRTLTPTLHTETQVETVRDLLDVPVRLEQTGEKVFEVHVR